MRKIVTLNGGNSYAKWEKLVLDLWKRGEEGGEEGVWKYLKGGGSLFEEFEGRNCLTH